MNIVARKAVKAWRQINDFMNGYNQGMTRRWSAWNKSTNTINHNKEVDCSTAFVIGATIAGIPWDNTTGTSTRNIALKARATGMYDVDYFDGDLSKLRPGGALLEPAHHIASMLDHGEMLSPEQTELHTTTGGKPGEQKSYEVRIRKAYKRRPAEKNGGWTYIINLTRPAVHMKRALVAFAKGNAWGVHIRRLNIIAPHDGAATHEFIKRWAALNKGMDLGFIPTTLVNKGKVAIVVLGTKLNPNGAISGKYKQRLQLTLAKAQKNPDAIVIVSGGKPYNGITEAQAGRDWLKSQGVDGARIHMEHESNSTVGNALYSVPLMYKLGVDSYVLVSHASHLRRAAIDFLAATLKMENAKNKSLELTQLRPLAIDDYAPNPVKPSLPVDDSDREAMGAEVISILGL
jgi:hypothetical protein